MKNKKIIIVMSIIAIVAISGAVFAYLFMATDIFKSDKELFAKYISQSIETIEKTMDIQTLRVYDNLRNEDKYESNTNIRIVHSEGGEISNPLNNLSGKIDIQKDKEQQYLYIDGQILYEDEKYLEAEVIKEENIYGIRLPEVVKQFLTLEKDEEVENVANSMGVDFEILQTILNVMDSNQGIISNEQIETVENKYSNTILKEVENGNFEKQKNIIIQTNNGEVKGNSYSMSLKSEQVKTILLEILNDVSEGIEIPSAKVTVFESGQKTIRTVVEAGNHKITIENDANMQTEYANSANAQIYKFQMNKENTEKQEKIDIIVDANSGEEKYQITFSLTMNVLENEIEFDSQVSHKQEITTISLEVENKVYIGKEFEKMETLDSKNNRLINSLEEQRRSELIDLLKQIVPQKLNQRIDLIEEKMWPTEEENEQEDNTESQVEINKFNAKFEFYTGKKVSAENVKVLLNTVKHNLKNYENINVEQQEDEKVKLNVKLNIEKDILNENAINEINEKITDNKKYNVQIFYKQSNGMIDYIIISEI